MGKTIRNYFRMKYKPQIHSPQNGLKMTAPHRPAQRLPP